MPKEDLENLEKRVDDLIQACETLKLEKNSLRSENGKLTDEHGKLLEKTRVARERIETMIGRLKALERS